MFRIQPGTLPAAETARQHLDGSVHAERKAWDSRLEGLEKEAASTSEKADNTSERLVIVEKAAEAGIESSKVRP